MARTVPTVGRIYILTDPRDGIVRYCGKTVKTAQDRLKDHLWARPRGMRRPLYRWFDELLNLGLCPQIAIVEEVSFEGLDREQQIAIHDEAEIRWIANLREAGTPLLNLTSGGNGAHGRQKSAEEIEKIRQANRGRIRTEETRQKLRDAAKLRGPDFGSKGWEHPNWGNPDAYDRKARNEKTRQVWMKKSEEERKAHGSRHRGMSNVNAKTTPEIARSIFMSSASAPQIARIFGVTEKIVWDIQTGKSWRHATEQCGAPRAVGHRTKCDIALAMEIFWDTRSNREIARAYGMDRGTVNVMRNNVICARIAAGG